MKRRWATVVLLALAVLACRAAPPPPPAQSPSERGTPPELVSLVHEPDVDRVENLSIDYWSRPWAFSVTRSRTRPLAYINNRFSDASGSLSVVLDDGRRGKLTVEARPCDPDRDCDRLADCGCFAEDSYWLDVADRQRRVVARVHLWAAYGVFMVAAVDLVDGPGDELVILRVPNRGSPPVGLDMKISTVHQEEPELLFDSDSKVAGLFWPTCAGFRTTVSVDLESPKPRDLTLQTEFGAMADCDVSVERSQLDDLKRIRVLSFDPDRRQFVAGDRPLHERSALMPERR